MLGMASVPKSFKHGLAAEKLAFRTMAYVGHPYFGGSILPLCRRCSQCILSPAD